MVVWGMLVYLYLIWDPVGAHSGGSGVPPPGEGVSKISIKKIFSTAFFKIFRPEGVPPPSEEGGVVWYPPPPTRSLAGRVETIFCTAHIHR